MSVTFMSTDFSSMDPRYQYLASKCSSGEALPRFETASEGEVPIFAAVSDLNAWKARTEVQTGVQVQHKGQWIVTARIPFDRFEELNKLPFVRSMEVAVPIQPLLKNTVKEVFSNVPIESDVLAQGGKGVVVGIVDFGCDFAHPNFKKLGGTKTRIHSIWVQSGVSEPDSQVKYGRLYTREEINSALKEKDPYDALGYRPEKSAHGTHVMDIAAGGGLSQGLAPKAKIMFVEPATASLKEKLCDSPCIAEAVRHIFDQAGDKPCVVNISLGQQGGAHDGTNLVEQFLDGLLMEKTNRAIVVAAGNSFHKKSHCSGTVAQGKHIDVKWQIKPLDQSENELEIWYSGEDEFEVEIFHEGSAPIARLPLGANGVAINDQKSTVAFASHLKCNPNNLNNSFTLIKNPKAKGGTWVLRLHGTNIKNGGEFHVWIERKNDLTYSTLENGDGNYTLGSLSTGQKTIVVGSYAVGKVGNPISHFSSAGPTRDGRFKPEVCAPGQDVSAANAIVGGITGKSGTSMAAPVVTGMVARLLGQAHLQKTQLDVDKIRNFFIDSYQKDSADQKWDSRYGYGCISTRAAILGFQSSMGMLTEEHKAKEQKKSEEVPTIKKIAKIALKRTHRQEVAPTIKKIAKIVQECQQRPIAAQTARKSNRIAPKR